MARKSKKKKKPGDSPDGSAGESSPSSTTATSLDKNSPASPQTPSSSASIPNALADVSETRSAIELEAGEIPPTETSPIPDAKEIAVEARISDPSLTQPHSEPLDTKDSTNSAKIVQTMDPDTTVKPNLPQKDNWANLFKGSSKPLSKKGEAFLLPSGEACVKIPNSIIEKHQKSWECFIIGQFYSEPPSQGLVHTIVNGIWSKQYRDITVSKLEGNAYLFRIPNYQTRMRVIKQRLWQIEGQTMFVDNWVPGVIPSKPELSSAPIWLELRDVPFQFFNDDSFERIAGLVGDPKFLHPSTANKTNLEVAKVFTIIDPRKPLPEAVNVQFQSGEIKRIRVSSPWMPPVCSHCKEIGHHVRRCKTAPIACSVCKSTAHPSSSCPRAKAAPGTKAKHRRKRSVVRDNSPIEAPAEGTIVPTANSIGAVSVERVDKRKSEAPKQALEGRTLAGGAESSGVSAAEPDSSDIESSDSEPAEADFDEDEALKFAIVVSQHTSDRDD